MPKAYISERLQRILKDPVARKQFHKAMEDDVLGRKKKGFPTVELDGKKYAVLFGQEQIDEFNAKYPNHKDEGREKKPRGFPV